MIVRVLEGVHLDGLHHTMLRVLMAACWIWEQHGVTVLWVTSAVRPDHALGSLHPSGRALDLRRWGLRDPVAATKELAAWLGTDYDVVLESDHVHVEFDPVARPTAGRG